MPEPKITFNQASKINWLVLVIIGSVLPLVWMAMDFIKFWTLETTTGLVDTTTEREVFFIGRYIGFPYGLLSLVTAINALKKHSLHKIIAVTGIISGVLNILVGLMMWIAFFMILALAAAF